MRKALFLVVLLTGCGRGFFEANGYVASDGGELGGWRRVPDGCSRDPFDGKSVGESGSVVTFVWQDPSVRDPHREMHRALVADEPMRLEIGRDESGLMAGLTTVKTDAVRIRARDCAVFEVDAREAAAGFAGGKATLGGRVRMDCRVGARHVTADLGFLRCGY